VTSADEFDAEVSALALKLASGPTVAYGAIRRSVEFSAGNGFADSLGFEASMMTLTGSTEDHRNAVSSFVDKERPVFTGR
jgi:2-(1,2-epoxy-1,2-dihydrophenyl)acetyl-CoA isomerase